MYVSLVRVIFEAIALYSMSENVSRKNLNTKLKSSKPACLGTVHEAIEPKPPRIRCFDRAHGHQHEIVIFLAQKQITLQDQFHK